MYMNKKLFDDQLLRLPTDSTRISDMIKKMDEHILAKYSVEMNFDAEFDRIRNLIQYFLISTGDGGIDEDIVNYLTYSIFATKGTTWINLIDLSAINLDIKKEFIELKDQVLTLNFNSMKFDDPGAVEDRLEDMTNFLYFYRRIEFIIDTIIRKILLEDKDLTQFNLYPMTFLRFSEW